MAVMKRWVRRMGLKLKDGKVVSLAGVKIGEMVGLRIFGFDRGRLW